MHDYVRLQELPALVEAHFPASQQRGINGHSMGGHGGSELCALRNPGRYQSVAFAPISGPMDCPWGQKAFTHYPGERARWREVGCLCVDQRGQ